MHSLPLSTSNLLQASLRRCSGRERFAQALEPRLTASLRTGSVTRSKSGVYPGGPYDLDCPGPTLKPEGIAGPTKGSHTSTLAHSSLPCSSGRTRPNDNEREAPPADIMGPAIACALMVAAASEVAAQEEELPPAVSYRQDIMGMLSAHRGAVDAILAGHAGADSHVRGHAQAET